MPNHDKLVKCPYDPVHKLKESRLQMHITKCRLNHLNSEKWTCPFNATHVLPQQENLYHLKHCPDKAPLDRKLAHDMDKNNPFKGRTAVPSYNLNPDYPPDETWDDDTEYGPGYVVPSRPPPGAIIEPPPYSKPAERRRMYREAHIRTDDDLVPEAEVTPHQAPSKPKPTIPRQPIQAPEVIRQMHAANGLEQGRGRIAANIFPANSGMPSSYIQRPGATNSYIQRPGATNIQPSAAANYQPVSATSYSTITDTFRGLGLGRGVAMLADDDEFPPLGIARGRLPKSASRN